MIIFVMIIVISIILMTILITISLGNGSLYFKCSGYRGSAKSIKVETFSFLYNILVIWDDHWITKKKKIRKKNNFRALTPH